MLLECTDLSKSYGKKPALNHLNLSLESGHIVGLLGPNGSGKTTLIKLISGLLTTNSGSISIDGTPVGPDTKKLVSYLPERTYLNAGKRVCDIIRFFTDFYDDFDAQRAYDMLTRLNIDAKDPIKSMSKGTREKVQLILVMSRRAKLYLLDEPIAGVDPAARDYIMDTILSNYDPSATLLISTHLISDVETILDEVVFIKNGNLLSHESVDDLRIQKGMSVDAYFREVFKC